MMPEPDEREVRFVCEHLRPASAAEMFLLLPTDDPRDLTRLMVRRAGISWVAYWMGEPAAILGAWPMHPGVWALFGFGTDSYAKVLGEVTRHARRVMFPAIKAAGAHRAQALSPAGHVETHKWLRLLGGAEEATLRRYGKNGEDVKVFAWFEESVDVRT